MIPNKFYIKFSTQLMEWYNQFVPMKHHLDFDDDSDAEFFYKINLSTLKSYEEIDVQTVGDQQSRLVSLKQHQGVGVSCIYQS